jgi:tetratricopeptide (TPR) repeat protein
MSQNASGSNIVQILGSNNSVTISGATALTLVSAADLTDLAPANPAPLDILRYSQRAVPLTGREAQMAQLTQWLAREASIQGHFLVAPAGTGKTRLALEFLLSLGQDWQGGFLPSEELARIIDQRPTWALSTHTLIVLDYATAKANLLSDFLFQIFQQRKTFETSGKKIRLLLLDRDATNFQTAFTQGQGYERQQLYNGYFPHPPEPLPGISNLEYRQAIYTATVRAVKPDFQSPSAQWFQLSLKEPRLADPLTLMMAALQSAALGDEQALKRDRLDLAHDITLDECKRIASFCLENKPPYAKALQQLAAWVTLCRGLTKEQLLETAARVLPSDLGYPGGLNQAIEDITKALGEGNDSKLRFIEPDLIGECLILESLPAAPATTKEICHLGEATIETLLRTIQNYPHPSPLQWLEALISHAQSLNPFLLFQIAFALPIETLKLRETGHRLLEMLLELLPADSPAEIRALLLGQLATFRHLIARREEALTAASEALAIRRELAASRPDAFLPDLAMSLNNCGNILSKLGRGEEALAAAGEALEIYRELAASKRGTFLPYVAASQNNYGIRLSELARKEEALGSAGEALKIYRELAAKSPDSFLPDVAMSLNNYGNRLSELGRREDALAAAREALDVYRELAATKPDSFLPNLASSLNNYGNRLNALERREEGLAAARKALEIRRQLAAKRPDAFLPDLARSFGSIAEILRGLDRHQEAAHASAAGFEALLPLSLQFPQAFGDILLALVNIHLAASDSANVSPSHAVTEFLEMIQSNQPTHPTGDSQ